MNAVREDVIKLVEKELVSANKKFPMFASNHEGYAVIKEEIEEAEECMENILTAISEVWINVKSNYGITYDNDALKCEAINGAIELIQVAAMAQKFIDSEESRRKGGIHIDD